MLHGNVSMKRALTICGYSVALFAAIGSLTWPLGRDQGIFTWVAQVVLGGGYPYRDAWDIKGPLSYYVYAIGLVLGSDGLGIRILDLASIAACCWFLRRLVFDLSKGDRYGANCAVIFFLLAYYGGGFWNSAQPDAWGGILVLVAVTRLLDNRKPTLANMAVIGGLIAAATLLKPTFLIFIALPIVGVFSGSGQRRDMVRPLLAFGSAYSSVVLLMLVFLWLGGSLREFIDVNRFVALSHSGYGNRHVFSEVISLLGPLVKLGLLMPLLIAPVGIWCLRSSGWRPQSIVLAAWQVLAIALVIIQGKYWLYHWIPAVIATATTAGLSIAFLTDRFISRVTVIARYNAIILLTFVAVMSPVAIRALIHSYSWPIYALGLETKDSYRAQFQTPDARWKYSDFATVSEYIYRNSTSRDAVLMWGWDPLVNILAQRTAPTRFGYSYPLTVDGPMRDAYRTIFLQDIGNHPPKFIVVDARDPWELPAKSGLSLLTSFPAFDSLLHRQYTLDTNVEAFQIWRLNEPHLAPN